MSARDHRFFIVVLLSTQHFSWPTNPDLETDRKNFGGTTHHTAITYSSNPVYRHCRSQRHTPFIRRN